MTETMQSREVAELFAQNVAETEYADLPGDAVEAAKRSILDVLGVAIGASGTVSEMATVVDLVKEAGGKEDSTIWAFGGKVPAWMAAFANGAMAHGLDYDDAIDDSTVHPSATTVPAAFAVAERLGGVAGKEFITAVALSNDLISRLARSVVLKGDWFITPVFGVFSAAAACGKLLRLGPDKLVDALGIAFCQSAGTMEIVYGVGSNIRAMYDGFVGKAGVLSAILAERGISGVKKSLEGKTGLFNVYFHGDYNRDSLVADLGKRFEGSRACFKPWPCCRRTHHYLTAILEITRQHQLSPENIQRIIIETGTLSQELCVPLEQRWRPATPMNAKYSIPYVVATAILKGKVTIADFSLEAIRNPETLALAEKVSPVLNTELDDRSGLSPGGVQVETRDGKVYSRWEDYARGHPNNPMSQEEAVEKFLDCTSHSARPLKKDNLQRVIQMVRELEGVEDVAEIVSLLV